MKAPLKTLYLILIFSIFIAGESYSSGICWLSYNPAEIEKLKTKLDEKPDDFENIPIMMFQNNHKQVPVYLLNSSTITRINPLIKYSFGIIHQMQPNWRTDHGMMRIQNVLADRDESGSRYFGEIHNTGISWFDLHESTKRLIDKEAPEVRMEAVYLLSIHELETVSVYQKLRRAAIFSLPNFFQKNNYPPAETLKVNCGTEHCFGFSKSYRSREATQTLMKMIHDFFYKNGISNEHRDIRSNETVQNFLGMVRFSIINTPHIFEIDQAAEIYHPNMVHEMIYEGRPSYQYLSEEFPSLNETQLKDLATLLISHDATLQFANLLDKLGVTSDNFLSREFNSPRLSAIFIHDKNPLAERSFNNGSYRFGGIQASWDHRRQSRYQK